MSQEKYIIYILWINCEFNGFLLVHSPFIDLHLNLFFFLMENFCLFLYNFFSFPLNAKMYIWCHKLKSALIMRTMLIELVMAPFFLSCKCFAGDWLNFWFPSYLQVDPSGELLLFSQGGCPWKEHLFALEKELQVETPIKFVLYPDQNGHWRIQCVPAGLNTFQNR